MRYGTYITLCATAAATITGAGIYSNKIVGVFGLLLLVAAITALLAHGSEEG